MSVPARIGAAQKFQSSSEIIHRFMVVESLPSLIARPLPVHDCFIGFPRFSEMMREDFGFSLGGVRKHTFQDFSYLQVFGLALRPRSIDMRHPVSARGGTKDRVFSGPSPGTDHGLDQLRQRRFDCLFSSLTT